MMFIKFKKSKSTALSSYDDCYNRPKRSGYYKIVYDTAEALYWSNTFPDEEGNICDISYYCASNDRWYDSYEDYERHKYDSTEESINVDTREYTEESHALGFYTDSNKTK